MSRHTEFYGGSPGPPIDSTVEANHGLQQYGSFAPGNHAYGGANAMFDAHAEGVNTGSADHGFYTHDGRNLVHSTFDYAVNPHVYHYGGPAFYYAGPAPYYPSHFVDTGATYTEWSSPDYTTPSNLSPPEVTLDESNSLASETRSSSNDSGSGKSRRFSRQRNFKDGDRAKSQNAVSGGNSKPKFRNIPKHEIRFSHQKKEPEKNKPLEQEDKIPEVSKPEDHKFSIIHSIGKREIDTGFKGKKSTQSETKESSKEQNSKQNKKRSQKSTYQSSESQLSVLLDQLTDGTYECMVCCDRVKQQHAIWNCGRCYHVFHMGCIKKWARSPAAHVEGEGWRCPGCQTVNDKFPNSYKCYCGKVNEPEWNRRETPHSCGEVCGKKRSNNATCTHPCNILCHPGPCPPCPASVIKPCLCGKMTRKVRCSQQKPLMCSEECGKLKNCGIHECKAICHSGECNACDVLVEQKCFCGKDNRNVLCGSAEFKGTESLESNAVYSCVKVCGKDLSCGNHQCNDKCHAGKCKSCSLLPSNVTTCPCTQTKISDLRDKEGLAYTRTQCSDPVPTCGKICGKPLKCGGESIHTCKMECHTGPCTPCADETSTIHCRCGKSENDVPCSEIPEELYICDRRCNKKRKCGRHKCGKTCCTDTEHLCTQSCGRKLECKLHRCEELCHRGNCHTCYNVSFDELCCHCGAEVMYPPIPCGTAPPECHRTCARQHSCFHPVKHNCHNEEKCPPCVVLLKKQCNCGRVMRNNIPCYQTNVSCGAPCKKVLPCGHNCLKPCHQGPCVEEGDKCTQPCSIMRVECIHPCAMPCHQGKACPPSLCKAKVTLKCNCGSREMQVACSDGGATYQRLSSEAFARQQNVKGSVDISNLFQSAGKQKVLPCDEQCSTIERNRRLAEALEIDEKNISEPEQQTYSPFLIMWARQDPGFIQSVETELTNIIDAVSWLDKTKRSHNFPSMKRDKRQVVHELAEAFNCQSVSIDEEPNRNVLVTALRGTSRIPRTLLSDSVKKKPVSSGCIKHAEPQTNDAPAPSKSTKMKLVSFTSVSGSTQDKPSVPGSVSKRPATIPRKPSYPSALSKLPGSSSTTKTYNDPFTDFRMKNSSEDSKSSSQRPISGSATSKSGGRRPSSNKKETNEPEIDYFDMTS